RGCGVHGFLAGGRFTGPGPVAVNGTTLRFKRAVIATGSRAHRPPVPGLAEAGFLTNDSIFELMKRPRRLAVIGAGPIGCELAQAFRRLGSEVTVFHTGSHILNREDADAAEIVQRAFHAEGIRLLFDARLARADPAADGEGLRAEAPRRAEAVTADAVLVRGRL